MLERCVKAGTCLILQAASRVRWQQANLGGVEGIGNCIEAVLEAKRTANRTPRYIKSLGYYLRQFAAGREERPLADFTVEDVESWLKRYPGQYSRQTWLNRLSTLFAFAVRRGYVSANPCDRLDRVTIDQTPPVILTPGQSRDLLAHAPAIMRPYIVLGMFAGIRPEEIERMDWAHIDLAAATARVEGKTRRRRLVPLHPRAVAELGKHPLRSGPVAPSPAIIARWRRTARAALGLAHWPQDLLRHTAASYLLALHGDAGKVATMLGNSSGVLLTHYHEPVRNGDCGEFWATAGSPTR
jgi:integrase